MDCLKQKLAVWQNNIQISKNNYRLITQNSYEHYSEIVVHNVRITHCVIKLCYRLLANSFILSLRFNFIICFVYSFLFLFYFLFLDSTLLLHKYRGTCGGSWFHFFRANFPATCFPSWISSEKWAIPRKRTPVIEIMWIEPMGKWNWKQGNPCHTHSYCELTRLPRFVLYRIPLNVKYETKS